MRGFLVGAGVMLAAMPAAAQRAAQSGWMRGGKPVTTESNLGSAGPLAVIQVSTADAAALIAAWPKPSPGTNMSGAARVVPSQLTTFLIFKGCAPDPAGLCNVTADFEVTGPRGASANQHAAPVRIGQPPANGLVLSATGFGLTLRPDSVPGVYHIRATMTDHVVNQSVRTEQVLTLTPPGKK